MASNYTCQIENISYNSITLALWTPQRSSFYNRYIVIILNILFFVIGTPFNTYVIISLFRKLRSTEPTMMLLLSLATADLMICIVILPITIITGIADNFVFGDSDYLRCQVCQIGLLFHIFSFASMNTIALISVDRFVYIWRPLRYHKYMTVKFVRSLIVAAWLLSIAVSITPLFGFGTIGFSNYALTCTVVFNGDGRLAMNSLYLLFLVLVAMIPLMTLIVTNVWVFFTALKSMRRHYKMSQKNNVDNLLQRAKLEKNRQQMRLFKVFIVILVTNVVTWVPVMTIMLSSLAYDTDSNTDGFIFKTSFIYLTLLSQSVVHPIVESRAIFRTKKKTSNVFSRICNKCCCFDEDISNQCCGRHCIFLDVCNAAFLPMNTDE